MNGTKSAKDRSLVGILLGRSKVRRTINELEAAHSQSEVATWKVISNR